MGDIIPLSYLVRQRQLACAEALRAWFGDLNPPPFTQALTTRHWTRDDQRLAPADGDPNWNLNVVFDYNGFEDGDISRGAVTTISDDIETLPDDTILLDNRRGAAPLTVDLTRSVTFAQSRQESTDTKMKIDIGSKVGGTIGGEAEGGTISAEISATFGIETDKGEIERESSDRTQTIHLATGVPVGSALLATISSPNLVTSQPFTVHADIDGPFRLEWASGLTNGRFAQLCHGPRYTGPPPGYDQPDGQTCAVHFTGFDDWAEAVNGYNVDFPGKADDGPLEAEHIALVMAARAIEWSGTVRREAQQTAGYEFATVSGPAVDAYAAKLPAGNVISGA